MDCQYGVQKFGTADSDAAAVRKGLLIPTRCVIPSLWRMVSTSCSLAEVGQADRKTRPVLAQNTFVSHLIVEVDSCPIGCAICLTNTLV